MTLMTLTEREGDVVALLEAGKSNREIARELDIEEKAVRSHVRTAFVKLKVSSRQRLIAQRLGQGAPDIFERICAAYTNILTNQERRVLTGMTRGLSNKEIARELSIATSTVKVYVKHILQKLQVKNRAAAILHAFSNHLQVHQIET